MNNKLLLNELKGCFNFFYNERNNLGLIKDNSNCNFASIASVGYGLAAYVIGVERKYISYNEAFQIVDKTLDTFLDKIETINGFYYHFLDINTGKRFNNCETSIIDTSIFICGALLCGEYFGDSLKIKANKLYERINWQWFYNNETGLFYMGYKPDIGFFGSWDKYAEQLMIYILAGGSSTYPVYDAYNNFTRDTKDDLIYSYFGSLFTYQYSHAWIDFRNLIDTDGINWFFNSLKATICNRKYCINNDKYKTYNENSWGLTASDGPNGYSGNYGSLPAINDIELYNDGTIAPCGAIGSIVFTPEEVINCIENYYKYPKLVGKYGLKDAYNLDFNWYSDNYIGIDKGISMIMIENYLTGLIWKYFMKNDYIIKGLNICGFKNIE